MATIFGCAPTSLKISSCIQIDKKIRRNQHVEIPKREGGRARCGVEKKGKMAAMIGVIGGVVNTVGGGAAVALVDERMSTEGTGLPFGLSNNILGWILLGVFGLIWAFYIVYTSGLDEDDDSGLSL